MNVTEPLNNSSRRGDKMDNEKKSLIWVIADERPGNYSQAIGLAEALHRPYEIKKISFNKFSKLPNFLRFGLLGVDEKSKQSLLNPEKKPQIIISAGRKTAPITSFLKKKFGAFAIHIMNPNMNFHKFDVVVVPEHDGILENDNVICSVGSLGRVDLELLKKEYEKFASDIERISSPKIVLLVGGSSKKTKFDGEVGKKLAKICGNIVSNMNCSFLVTTSRRTGKDVIAELKKTLGNNGLFFEWEEGKANPYFAFLNAADFIIATGDSMSMCSESCSLGKPVYIFNPQEICSKKHLRFHQNLFSKNYAKKLDSDLVRLENWQNKKLDETNRIGTKINKLLELKNL